MATLPNCKNYLQGKERKVIVQVGFPHRAGGTITHTGRTESVQ